MPDFHSNPGRRRAAASTRAAALMAAARAFPLVALLACAKGSMAASPPKIDAQPLSPKLLKAHVDKLQGKLDKALRPPFLERARAVHAAMPKGEDYLPSLRAAANGLAVAGFWPEATWLMGRLAQASGDVNDLNNLAAFVTLQGAPAPALPILHTLDHRYPGNSTLLNNLGQAYFQLGATEEAERYLAAAVRAVPAHPQANVTRAVLFRAKGDKAGAQAALRMALDGGYSQGKVTQLRKAGAKWQAHAGHWHLPMAKDPLGLERFVLPPFPKDAEAMVKAVPLWAQFHDDLRALKDELDAKRVAIMRQAQGPEHQAKVLTGLMKNMPFSGLATEVMKGLQTPTEHTMKRATEALTVAWANEANRVNALTEKLEAMEKKNDKTYANDTAAAEAHRCDGVPQAYASYLQAGNTELQEVQTTYLEALRKSLNETTYLLQFTLPTAEDFEAAKLGAKSAYLNALIGTKAALANSRPGEKLHCLPRAAPKGGGKLADFGDIRCSNVIEFNLLLLGEMKFRCNTAEANFHPGFSPFEFAFKIRTAGNSDEWEFVNASAAVEIKGVKVGAHGEFDEQGLSSGGVSAGAGTGTKVKTGPLQLGVGASGQIGVEIDRGGVSDVIIKGGVGGSASSTAIDTQDGAVGTADAKVGAGGTWSWSAGPSSETSGSLNASVLSL